MAINFGELRQSSAETPPRIIIYGAEGMGKNTLALEFPAPLTFDFESGTPPGWPILTDEDVPNFAALLGAIGDLISEEHDFKTIIFDSLDKIEAMIFAHVCETENFSSIEQPGYGKGYKLALDYWRELVNACRYLNRARNVAIIFIAHSEASRFDDPTTQSYSRYDLRLNEKAAGVIKDDCDAIMFINQRVNVKEQEVGRQTKVVKGDSGESRWVYTEARAAFAAKNRYDIPAQFKYDKGKGYEFLAPYLPSMDTPTTAVDDVDEDVEVGEGVEDADDRTRKEDEPEGGEQAPVEQKTTRKKKS